MEWNVYHHNINKKKIEAYNIFDHYSFCKNVKKAARECFIKEDFIEQLKSELFYYFWSKAEWEVVITSWCGGDREKDAVKIDVYNQVMMNFDVFADYVWNNRNKLFEVGEDE